MSDEEYHPGELTFPLSFAANRPASFFTDDFQQRDDTTERTPMPRPVDK